jgi:hypothetical protein
VDLNVNIECVREKNKDSNSNFEKQEINIDKKLEQSEEKKCSANSMERRKFWESKANQGKDQKMTKNIENTQEKVERSESFRERKQLWERRTPELEINKDKKNSSDNMHKETDNMKDRKRMWEKSTSGSGQKGKVVEVENKAKMVGNREVRLESSSESLDRDSCDSDIDRSSRGRSVSSGEHSSDGNETEESERSVRLLSQMFERQGSRASSVEPESEDGATGGVIKSSPRQRDSQPLQSTSKPSKPWTTIL